MNLRKESIKLLFILPERPYKKLEDEHIHLCNMFMETMVRACLHRELNTYEEYVDEVVHSYPKFKAT